MPDKANFKISTLISIASLLYLVTAAAGLVYNVLYYKEFSIDISNYIGLDECLLLFMPKIRAIGFFFFLFSVGTFAAHLFWRKVSLNGYRKVSIVIAVAFLPFCWPILENSDFAKYRAFFFAIIPIVIITVTFILKAVDKELKFKLSNQQYFLIYVIFMFIYGTVALSYLNVEAVRTYKKVSRVIIHYKDSTSIDTAEKANKFIGRTRNYIFFYDSSRNIAKILSAENVKRLELKK